MSNRPVAWVEFTFLGDETKVVVGGDVKAKGKLADNKFLHEHFVEDFEEGCTIVNRQESHELYVWCLNNASKLAGEQKFKLTDRRTVFYFAGEKQ